MLEPITIDVWSDVACPWCYIGKRRLEAALELFTADGGRPVIVEFHSFQLDPGMPEDFEGSAADYLARHKGIPADDARQMQRQVSQVAGSVGLEYDFAALKPANTSKAHQVLHFAKAHGVQLEAKEALMRAHFVEGRHVGDDQELATLVGEIGLDPDAFLASLHRNEYLPAVTADEELARRIGIRGVPFFVIDGRYGISGAQRVEIFTDTLERAAAESEAAQA